MPTVFPYVTFDPLRAPDVESVPRKRSLDESETEESSGEVREESGEERRRII